MEKLRFFYSSEVDESGCHLDKVFSMLNRLKKAGVSCEFVDTSEMDEKELHKFYTSEAVYPTMIKHYRIGHIFGTQKRAGIFFGKEQPALLVYEEEAEGPTDIFPHTIKGRRVSIEDFLEEKVAELEKEE